MLYDVYVHPDKGSWGLNLAAAGVSFAELAGDGRLLRQGRLQPHLVAAEVSKRVRLGYAKLSKPRYLQVSPEDALKNTARFVESHPEIGGDDVVCYAALSVSDKPQEIAEEFGQTLERTAISPAYYDAWLERLARAQSYLVAADGHPALALVLADWAINKGRVLIGGEAGIPQKLPKVASLEWSAWLGPHFKPEETRAALEQLGWSLKHVLLATTPAQEITADDGDNWMLSAKSAAF